MKTLKYIALAAVSTLMLASCDNKTEEGAGDAVIGFAKDAYTFKESAGLVRIPMSVEGEAKYWPICFDIKAEISVSDEPEIENIIHFTQATGLKYAGNPDAPAYVEFSVIDNLEINDNRTVKLTIENVKGATVGTGSTVVEIADNDNNPYDRLMGDWVLNGTSIWGEDGYSGPQAVRIIGGFTDEEVAANADKTLVCVGFINIGTQYIDYRIPVWYLDYYAEEGYLKLRPNTVMVPLGMFGFNSIDEDVTVYMWPFVSGAEAATAEGDVYATWSDDCNTITFDPGAGFGAELIGESGTDHGDWDTFVDITMTRK